MKFLFRFLIFLHVLFAVIQFAVSAAVPLQTNNIIRLNKPLAKDSRIRVSCQLEEVGDPNSAAAPTNENGEVLSGRSVPVSRPETQTVEKVYDDGSISSVSTTVVNNGGAVYDNRIPEGNSGIVSSSSVVTTNDGPGGMTKSVSNSYTNGGLPPGGLASLFRKGGGDSFGNSLSDAISNIVANAPPPPAGVTSSSSVVVNNEPGGFASGESTVVNNGGGNMESNVVVVNPGSTRANLDDPDVQTISPAVVNGKESVPLNVPQGVPSNLAANDPEAVPFGMIEEDYPAIINSPGNSVPVMASEITSAPSEMPVSTHAEIPAPILEAAPFGTIEENSPAIINSPGNSDPVMASEITSAPLEIPVSTHTEIPAPILSQASPASTSVQSLSETPTPIPARVFKKIPLIAPIPTPNQAEFPASNPVHVQAQTFAINPATIPAEIPVSIPEHVPMPIQNSEITVPTDEKIPVSTPAEIPTQSFTALPVSNPIQIDPQIWADKPATNLLENLPPNSLENPVPPPISVIPMRKISIPVTITLSVPEHMTRDNVSPVLVPIIVGVPLGMFGGNFGVVPDPNPASTNNNFPESNIGSSISTAVNDGVGLGSGVIGGSLLTEKNGGGLGTGFNVNSFREELLKNIFGGGLGGLPATGSNGGFANSISAAVKNSIATRMANSAASVVVNGKKVSGGNGGGVTNSESVAINNGVGESVSVRSTVVNKR